MPRNAIDDDMGLDGEAVEAQQDAAAQRQILRKRFRQLLHDAVVDSNGLTSEEIADVLRDVWQEHERVARRDEEDRWDE